MIFTKNIDVYTCDDQDDITAEDKLCGIISKDENGYWRWHTNRKIVLTCGQLKQISLKLSELNRSGE